MDFNASILPFLLLIPLVAAVLIVCGAPARSVALFAAGLNLGVALIELISYSSPFAYTLFDVVPALDLKFLVGLDGLSLMMVLLTTIVTLSAVWVSPKVSAGENAFYACLLFISAGALGAFISLDIFFFYAFHELALIPTFLLIGIWGHGDNRVAAAWKITIYLAAGSFVLLLGLIALYANLPPGQRTFDLTKLTHFASLSDNAGLPIDPAAQRWIFPLLLIGFGTLISLFPFHTWAPPAYAAAPTPAAMLHSGVLKKLGLYGLLRIAVPLMPFGFQYWMNWLLVLLVGNILYVGFVTISQKRLDLMLGYSSVMHMGYIFLGISSLNVIGLSGAALLMFAHGLSIAALFAVAGEVRGRTGTMRFDELGGLATTMPWLSFIFGLAMFASIGLPGFANFASEVMVFFGTFGFEVSSLHKLNYHQVAVVCGLWGVVMSAVYMLRAYRRTFLGPLASAAAAGETLNDPPMALRWPLILLIAGLVVVGFSPHLLLDYVKPSIAQLAGDSVGSPVAGAGAKAPPVKIATAARAY